VTRVITEQIHSIGTVNDTLVVCGEAPSQQVDFHYIVIPSLAYDRDRKDHTNPEETALSILDAVHSVWKEGADLYHIHNPTLGKNKDFINIIKAFLSMNMKLLLQIHDFSEDGRPGNYLYEEYPANCHYAVLNSRDYAILRESGAKEEGLHLLPNPVPVRPLSVQNTDHEAIVLYPVRAIRRKNIGEAVLLSLFLSDIEKVGITLEPTGELDVKSYRDWQSFVRREDLRVSFRLGIDHTFEWVLERTRCMITTSIKEGFGFSFLEPWTGGKMLFGRLLSDICIDFKQRGVDLGHLYTRIAVPFHLFDFSLFRNKWIKCYVQKMNRYGLPVTKDDASTFFQSLLINDTLDFAFLSEELQKQVILQILEKKKNKKIMLDLNLFLENINDFDGSDSIIERNRRVVGEQYSMQKNRARLLDIYQRVVHTKVGHAIDNKSLLRAFNAPEKSHLLLCDAAYE